MKTRSEDSSSYFVFKYISKFTKYENAIEQSKRNGNDARCILIIIYVYVYFFSSLERMR